MITPVNDQSQVAHARRRTTEFAAAAGLPEQRVDKVAVVATELATNLLKHAGCGELIIDRFDDADGSGVEILSLDRGPGMKDINACMRDGFSTAGSLGQGLGAIARQSDQMRIYSRPGLGTVASARFVVQPPVPGVAVQCGAAVMPHPGESVCGDRWTWARTPAGPVMMMADGSGHGPEAGKAAAVAEEVFHDHAQEPSVALMERLHRALMPTRGAAIAIARIDTAGCSVSFTGVGNIGGTLIANGRITRMVSHGGIAGHVTPRIHEFIYSYNSMPLVILHSDGLTTKWDLAGYPGLATQHPSLLAGVLLRDFRRGRDDASVVVMRALV